MKIPVLKLIQRISEFDFVTASFLMQQAEEATFMYEEMQSAIKSESKGGKA